MSKEVIATVRLAVGEVGYYDDLSCIHLTVNNPQKNIFAGTNCTKLRRAVKSGRLRLFSGSLGEEKKLEIGKKGNKFTGPKLAELEQVTDCSQVVSPTVEEVAPTVEETGVEGFAPVESVEVVVKAVESVIDEVVNAEKLPFPEGATEEDGSKKSTRKKKIKQVKV